MKISKKITTISTIALLLASLEMIMSLHLYARGDKHFILIAISALIVGVLFLLRYVLRKSLVPLERSADTLRSIAEGDLTSEVPGGPDDGIGQLLSSMQLMRSRLQSVIGKVQSMSKEVAARSDGIDFLFKDVVSMYSALSDSITTIASSTQEVSYSINDIAQNAAEISSQARKTSSLGRDGAAVVDKARRSAMDIHTMNKETSKIIYSLNNNASKIENITQIINDITDQINLLSLNAAIEAARAGDAGRGFAIVAEEVRKLADKTSRATGSITNVILSVRQDTEKAVITMTKSLESAGLGVSHAEEAGTALGQIVESMSHLEISVDQIAAATEEISEGGEVISKDIESVNEASIKTGINVKMTSRATSELAALSENLGRTVDYFKSESDEKPESAQAGEVKDVKYPESWKAVHE